MKRSATNAQLALPWASQAAATEPAPVKITSVIMAPPPPPQLAPPAPVEPEGPDVIERFVAYRQQRNHSKRTRKGTHYDLRAIQRAIKVPLLAATYPQLDGYFAAMTVKGLKPGTIKRHMANVRMFFRWAMRVDLVTKDPTTKLEAPKSAKRLPRHLSEEECDRLVADLNAARAAHELRDACAIALLFYTGMRAGELLRLNVEDWKPGTDGKGTIRVIGKGDKERVLPIAPALVPYVERWIASHPVGHGPLLVRWRAPWARLRYPGLLDLFNQFKGRAGLPAWVTPHKLRHTAATRLLRGGVPPEQIQILLGHESITTTMIYSHAELPTDMVEKLGAIFK